MSFVYATYRIEVGLYGDYATVVKADVAAGYWPLTDALASATAADTSGNNHPGTVIGGVTFGQATLHPDAGTAALLNGTTGYIAVPHATGITPTGDFTVECWIKKPASALDVPLVQKFGGGANPFDGFLFSLNGDAASPGKVTLWTGQSWVHGATRVDDDVRHHIAAVLTGTTVKFYIDGALDATTTPSPAARLGDTHALEIGRRYDVLDFAAATIDRVVLTLSALSGTQILTHYLAGVWTSLGNDVAKRPAPHWTRGNRGNGPLDHVAGTGMLECSLRNDGRNTGSTEGWYSPNHVNCRPGWGYGIPVRLVSTYQSVALGDASPVDRTLWRGKVAKILPDAGKYGPRQVHVSAQDCMGDLADSDLIQIAPQLGQTESALIQAVLSALPASALPPAVSLDSSVDTYPYAFDTIGNGVKAMSAMTDVATSAYGWIYSKADGTLRYESRRTRALKSSSFTFTELTHDDVVVPSDLANVYNRVRVTIHPRTVDAAATTVLCAAPAAVLVPAVQSVTVWDTYRDQTNTLKLIGGTAFVTPIAATTDYLGNAASDGSGATLTANLSLVTTAFAAAARFVITNTGTTDVYLTKRQLRGKGIYDNAPVTFETYLAKSYGDRPLEIDLPFQSDPAVAQAFATYIANLYSALANQASSVSLNPQRSDALLTQALTRDVGDLITESETMTGMSSALLAILGVEGTIEPGQLLALRYVVGWAGTGNVFIFDDAVHGVFDSALSPLGYA